jgi:hypothetical protein
MKKFAICLICILAGMFLMMPCTAANSNQNGTQNATPSVMQNLTQNVMQNVMQNATQNLTQDVMQNLAQNVTQDLIINDTQSAIQNDIPSSIDDVIKPEKVLRVGFAKTKPLNNLDVYGSKATYNIRAWSVGSSAFNLSQRLGKISNITYNTNINKPVYQVNEYTRVKPNYEVPSNLGSKQIYKISGYPLIKVPSSMP